MNRGRAFLLTSLFSLLICTLPLFGQADTARTKRLTELARVWNTVKYFHPYLAEKEVDWDKALVETIPKVNAAKSPGEFSAAINGMFSVLGDKATFAAVESQPTSKPSEDTRPPTTDQAIRFSSGILTVDLVAAAKIMGSDQSQMTGLTVKITEALPATKGVVFDCRSTEPIGTDDDGNVYFFFDDFLKRTIPIFVQGEIPMGTHRYRTHDGYVPQIGNTSGGYFSSLVTDAPKSINGRGSKKMPIAFLINKNSPDEAELLSGLRFSSAAVLIFEGDTPSDLGSRSFNMKLSDGVSTRIRISEFINPDGSTGFTTDRVIRSGTGDSSMDAAKVYLSEPSAIQAASVDTEKTKIRNDSRDKVYPEMAYPAAEYRLLALFRFWGVIDLFYPYKDLIADTWETVLPRFISKFEGCKNALEYQTAIYELATEIHDSHGAVQGALAFDLNYGTHMPPVVIQYVENRPVVTKILDPNVALKVGDVIEEVDGKPESEVRARIGSLFATSTPQSLRRTARTQLLRGAKDSAVRLTVHSGTEKSRTVELKRTIFRFDPTLSRVYFRTTPVVDVLPSGFGYVDLARLQVGEVDGMFNKIMPTKGVIFDMRGYPNGTAWEIAPRLTTKKNVPAAQFTRPIINARSLIDSDLGLGELYSFRQPIPVREGEVYRGKVVMLIDENAISQAEHTCLFFESATNVTFIGSPTNGANGDVTNLVLPGGIYVNFSGQAVRHADGRQLQRMGIQPDVKAAPTIAGIIAGRDEVLETAVDFLRKTIK